MNNTYDCIVIIASICLSLYFMVGNVLAIRDIKNKTRVKDVKGSTIFYLVIASVLFTASFLITVYAYSGSSKYNQISDNGLVAIVITYCMFLIYYILTSIFVKDELRLVTVTMMGIFGSLGYAFIMFLIDNAVQGANDITNVIFFLMAIITYVYAQKLVRTNIIKFANQQVYKFRRQVFDIVLYASHEKLERTDSGRIYTCINNDLEVLGVSMRDVATVSTNILTIIICFAYLAILHWKSFLFIFVFFVIAFTVQMLYVKKQEVIFELLMTIQHNLYNFLDSLIKGHKELVINQKKQEEYSGDLDVASREYMNARINAENKMTNSFVIGQSLLYVVIGMVVFILPLIFHDVTTSILQSYIMIFLFIINPISYLVDLSPKVFQAKISYDRVKKLIKELKSVAEVQEKETFEEISEVKSIELKDVYYSYNEEVDGAFHVGPLNCSFEGGKINFIIGGNGSGESTVSKILTGLYEEQRGEVLVNGKKIAASGRGRLFSAVFSDYYLFKRIYGIDLTGKEDLIKTTLEKLRMEKKVSIEDGSLSTIDLSSGQKKRIALLLCYLENNNVYLFDEWAADQDVEFRDFFYRELLPEIREQGKTIIAITHDDRYFDVADNIFRMEMGQLRQIESNKEE